MENISSYTVVSYIMLYLIVGMCFISYIWMRESMERLSKGYIYNLFKYILWIVRWGFLCATLLFIIKLKIIKIDCSYLIESFAIFISFLFMIVSYISIKMREIGRVFGFKELKKDHSDHQQ